MKRKLISFEIFESIQQNSLSNAEKELVEAAPVLAKALDVDGLELLSFDGETAMYESVDGNYVHAAYKMNKGQLAFENITQLAIDQDTEKAQSHQEIGLLVDALLENKNEEAAYHFDKYMGLPSVRRVVRECNMMKAKGKKKAKTAMCESKKGSKAMMCEKMKGKKAGKAGFFAKKAGMKNLKEWRTLSENVFSFVDYKQVGPILNESEIVRDGRDVVAVRMPVSEGRTVAQMLKFDYKTLPTEVKTLRGKAKKVAESSEFAKAIAELKRHNNMSDNNGLEEAIEKIIGQWPEVLYLTQDELAGQIKTALESANASNFDDQTCAFMAEGILRSAHGVFTDKVNKIVALSGAKVNEEAEDQYEEFKTLVNGYFASLDESTQREFQMFVDLYEALRHVYNIATQENDDAIRTETAAHLNELLAIVQQEVAPDLSVAEQAAGWLNHLIESGLQAWNVTSTAHLTVNGDHPQMAKNATVPAIPGRSEDEYGQGAASTGKGLDKAEKAAQQSAWTGAGDADKTFPGLNNPYILKPFGDYTMKGEKGVDKDGDTTLDPHDNDTWPSLKNPYVPQPDNSVFRMKSDDLVVDK